MNHNIQLKDLKLKQYQEFLEFQKKIPDGEILAAKLIEIFYGISYDAAFNIKMGDVNKITDDITRLLNEKPKLIKKFTLNKIEYGFIPSLDDMSLGEYIDVDTFIGDWQNMHKAMGVLYRPITQKHKHKYSIEDYKVQDNEHLKDMPLNVVFSSIIFFYHLGIDLSQVMMDYLEENKTEDLTQFLNSEGNGVGISQFMHSLKGTLQNLKISLN